MIKLWINLRISVFSLPVNGEVASELSGDTRQRHDDRYPVRDTLL